MRPVTLFLLLSAFAVAPAWAAMFKWTDANGEVQYGQYPPAGVKTERLRPTPPPKSATPAPSLQQQVDVMDKQREENQKQEAENAKKKQDAAQRKQNCVNARTNLGRLNLGGNRLMRMPDGSYQRLDATQRQAEIKTNQDAIDKYCN